MPVEFSHAHYRSYPEFTPEQQELAIELARLADLFTRQSARGDPVRFTLELIEARRDQWRRLAAESSARVWGRSPARSH